MAEEIHKPEAPAPAPSAEKMASTEEAAKPFDEKESPPAPKPVPEAPEKPVAPVEEQPAVEAAKAETPKAVEEAAITQPVPYKEETSIASELPQAQKKALDELKQLVQEAINKNEFTVPPPPPPAPAKEEKKPAESEKTEEKDEECKAEAPPTAEEPKPTEPETAEPTPPSTAEVKVEEKVEVKEEKGEVKGEETKVEVKEEKVEVKEEETKVEVAVEAAVEKVTTVDEDGAKTVEAFEKTVVAVTSASATAAAEPGEAKAEETPAPPQPPPEEVSIWGIPLLTDERSDVILLKFLRARDFKVKDAFTMIKNTVRWRKDFGIEALLEEDLGSEYDKIVYMHGFDKEGHPVCYNAYSAFQDKELYQSCFGDEKKRVKFLRWRIQFLEKSIRKLDFTPGGISTIFQVNDLKDSPWLGKREIRQALNLLQDNYPEFVARQVFINVPWWYLAFNRIISPFLTQRTKSKFEFAGPAKSAETLFKYIAPEQVPVHYGGLSKEGEFTVSDSVTEAIVKLTSKHTVEIPVTESCLLVWELRAVGWDVSYGAEFVPDAEGGYTVIVSKSRKITPSDDPVISDTYKIGEPGKVVITVDNQTSKKKKLLYRFKTKPVSE